MKLLVVIIMSPHYLGHVCPVLTVKKASSYIAQYPVLRTIQSVLHFTSLTDLFTQTPSRLLWESSSHMLHLMRESCSHTYLPLSIARYSFIQLSELEQCRVKKLSQGFNTVAQDWNPGSRSRESETLTLSHCALQITCRNNNVTTLFRSRLPSSDCDMMFTVQMHFLCLTNCGF